MATIISGHNLTTVDRLGEIKAQIADLTKIHDAMSAEIKSSGPGRYEGEMFVATVSEVEERSSPDPKAVAEKLREVMGDDAYLSFVNDAANRKTTAGYCTIRLASR